MDHSSAAKAISNSMLASGPRNREGYLSGAPFSDFVLHEVPRYSQVCFRATPTRQTRLRTTNSWRRRDQPNRHKEILAKLVAQQPRTCRRPGLRLLRVALLR